MYQKKNKMDLIHHGEGLNCVFKFWFSTVKEGCWHDDPGQGLMMLFDFRGREEDLFCKVEVGCELAYLGGVLGDI